MRSIWRRVIAVWLAAVLVPSLLGGGACLSHAFGGASELSTHASHVVVDPHASHAVVDSNADHAGRTATAMAAVAADEVADATPHDCCPQQGGSEHCSGASGCTAAVSSDNERALSAPRIIAALNRATSPAAPPGPAHAPDVPPPRG